MAASEQGPQEEPTQQFFESQRLRLSYWTWGDEANPPLVLIHGGRDHARSWDLIAKPLAERYYVAALDMRGHGDSQWAVGSQYGLPDNMLDVVRLVEVLGGRARAVAHSYGGQVTLLAAGTYPECFDAVVAIEGTGSLVPKEGADGLGPAWLRKWGERARGFEGMTPRVYPTVEAAAERMMEANRHLTPELARHLAEYGTRRVDGGNGEDGGDDSGYVWKFDNWVHGRTSMEVRHEDAHRVWGAIECPVLLLYGGETNFALGQGERDAEHFQDARTVIVPDAAHWVHHDQTEATVREIRAFFEGNEC